MSVNIDIDEINFNFGGDDSEYKPVAKVPAGEVLHAKPHEAPTLSICATIVRLIENE
jgi:hypothetical protein